MAIAALAAMLVNLMQQAEALGVQGLSFQHIMLCPTRAWLHYHRLDCAHLNRHMQLGLLLHERSADPLLYGLYGLAPDRLDWGRREVSEIKKSRSYEAALVNQLMFYVAALTVATGEEWHGVLRYTSSRRTKTVRLDEAMVQQLQQSLTALHEVVRLSRPPPAARKTVCGGCSFALLCWGEATDGEDE